MKAAASTVEAGSSAKSSSVKPTAAKTATGEMMPAEMSEVTTAAHNEFSAVIGAGVAVVGAVIPIVRARVRVIAAIGRVADPGVHGTAV
jgi:hypothetical protein